MKSFWSKCILSAMSFVAVLGLAPRVEAQPASPAVRVGENPKTFAYAVISVADIDQALGLWREQMGMEIVTRRKGPDAALAKVWGIAPEEISDQALLRTPGAREGGLHLIRFREPGKPVREGAAPSDLVPKSLDIWTRDIHGSYDKLKAAGYKFRSPVQQLSAQLHIMGDKQADLGRIEIVQYTGAPQRNLYPLARPPARGLLSATYFVPELDSFLARGASLGITDPGEVKGVYGTGRMATATTPAGLCVNLFAPRRQSK